MDITQPAVPVGPAVIQNVETGYCPYCGGMSYRDRIGEWKHVYPPCRKGK